MKYFCAWLATCVGVLDITKFLEMLLQSPFPNLSRPNKNNLKKAEKKKNLCSESTSCDTHSNYEITWALNFVLESS